MKIMILGGYGGAGKVFCRYLLNETDATIVVAGRRMAEAERLTSQLSREFSPERVSARHVDASDADSLRSAFREIDFLFVAATTTQYAKAIAEAALEANIDYLDIYYDQEVYNVIEPMKERVTIAGRCFVTQAGFHPGVPAVCVRKGAVLFDACDSANVAMAMSAHIETPESIYELVDALAHPSGAVYDRDRWRSATYKDMRTFDFGGLFGRRTCFPLDLVEMRSLPEQFGLQSAGVYVAGFNWAVDNLVFPFIMVSQKLKLTFLRHFWAWVLMKGINMAVIPGAGVSLLLAMEGASKSVRKSVRMVLECNDAYDFTVIPVIAFLKQYMQGNVRKPGLWMMGHTVEVEEFFREIQRLGVKVTTVEDVAGA